MLNNSDELTRQRIQGKIDGIQEEIKFVRSHPKTIIGSSSGSKRNSITKSKRWSLPSMVSGDAMSSCGSTSSNHVLDQTFGNNNSKRRSQNEEEFYRELTQRLSKQYGGMPAGMLGNDDEEDVIDEDEIIGDDDDEEMENIKQKGSRKGSSNTSNASSSTDNRKKRFSMPSLRQNSSSTINTSSTGNSQVSLAPKQLHQPIHQQLPYGVPPPNGVQNPMHMNPPLHQPLNPPYYGNTQPPYYSPPNAVHPMDHQQHYVHPSQQHGMVNSYYSQPPSSTTQQPITHGSYSNSQPPLQYSQMGSQMAPTYGYPNVTNPTHVTTSSAPPSSANNGAGSSSAGNGSTVIHHQPLNVMPSNPPPNMNSPTAQPSYGFYDRQPKMGEGPYYGQSNRPRSLNISEPSDSYGFTRYLQQNGNYLPPLSQLLRENDRMQDSPVQDPNLKSGTLPPMMNPSESQQTQQQENGETQRSDASKISQALNILKKKNSVNNMNLPPPNQLDQQPYPYYTRQPGGNPRENLHYLRKGVHSTEYEYPPLQYYEQDPRMQQSFSSYNPQHGYGATTTQTTSDAHFSPIIHDSYLQTPPRNVSNSSPVPSSKEESPSKLSFLENLFRKKIPFMRKRK